VLRPYQLAAVEAIWNNLYRHVVASLPTGSGKSHIIAEICRRALEYFGTHILILAHVRELLLQNAEKIQQAIPGAPVGLYCAGFGRKEIAPITVASVQSLARARDLPTYDLIIVDEAHRIPHGSLGQYHAIFDRLPEAKICGLTATPYRLDGGLLHEGDEAIFDDLVYECRTADLIEQGFLCPIHSYRGTEADLDGLHTRGGEFITSEMSDRFCEAELVQRAVTDVLTKAADRNKIMIFCCSVEHCRMVMHELAAQGQTNALMLTGKTPKQDRIHMIEQFRDGDLRFLVNCDVLTTGFDSPNVDCIALMRATQSPGLFVQMVGRGLRLHPDKASCLLLDFGGNVRRHGPIDSITATSVNSKEGPAPIKTCPDCGAILPCAKRQCECGYVFAEPKPINHEATADDGADPIELRIEQYDVLDVRYDRHRKPGKPDSLKVSYVCQDGFIPAKFSEWVCPEHHGFAASKAQAWFARRGLLPAPVSVDDALTRRDAILKPQKITVRHSKYPEVISYAF